MDGPFGSFVDVINDDVRIIPHIVVQIFDFGLGNGFDPGPLQRWSHRFRLVTCKQYDVNLVVVGSGVFLHCDKKYQPCLTLA